MFVQFRYKDKIIQNRYIDAVPMVGHHILFYSHNSENLGQINVVEYVVMNIAHYLQDPAPAEKFISDGIGKEVIIINLLTINDFQKNSEPTNMEKPE